MYKSGYCMVTIIMDGMYNINILLYGDCYYSGGIRDGVYTIRVYSVYIRVYNVYVYIVIMVIVIMISSSSLLIPVPFSLPPSFLPSFSMRYQKKHETNACFGSGISY